MSTILKLEHIQKYYGNEGNITKAIQDICCPRRAVWALSDC